MKIYYVISTETDGWRTTTSKLSPIFKSEEEAKKYCKENNIRLDYKSNYGTIIRCENI